MNRVIEAYLALLGTNPPEGMEFGEVCRAVVENFDGSVLDENLGRDALEIIITASGLTEGEVKRSTILRAENLLPEICEDYPDLREIHMADVERVLYLRAQGAFSEAS